MFLNFIFIIVYFRFFTPTVSQLKSDIECPLGDRHRARAKPYYPSFDQGGFIDMDGAKLNSFQEFLSGEAKFVTLSLDSQVPIPVGTQICIPEFNRKYKKNIIFKYRDTGPSLQGKQFTVFHMCIQNETYADDKFFHQFFTLVIPKNPKVSLDGKEDDTTLLS